MESLYAYKIFLYKKFSVIYNLSKYKLVLVSFMLLENLFTGGEHHTMGKIFAGIFVCFLDIRKS